MKILIRCVRCGVGGKNQTLAELKANNIVDIARKRSTSETWDHTILNGSDFEIGCGECGLLALERKGGTNFVQPNSIFVKEESSDYRQPRILGGTFSLTLGSVQLYSNQGRS